MCGNGYRSKSGGSKNTINKAERQKKNINKNIGLKNIFNYSQQTKYFAKFSCL